VKLTREDMAMVESVRTSGVPRKTITHQAVEYLKHRDVTVCYSKWTDGSVTSNETEHINGFAHMGFDSPACLPSHLEWVDTVKLRAEVDAMYPPKVSP
jgi:hypothetical protein